MMNEYFGLAIFLLGIWVVVFILMSQSWQLAIAFLPFSVYLLLNQTNWSYYILFCPVLCLLVIDIHILPTDMAWKGWKKYLPYLFSLPFTVQFVSYAPFLFKDSSLAFKVWCICIGVLISTLIGKMWVGDVIMLLINRLRLKSVAEIECSFRKQKAERAYRHIRYLVQLSGMEMLETSGFFYWYLKFRNVEEGDLLRIKIKTGCFGLEFISGFPKIVSRKNQLTR
ncbi:hypothetical protein OQX63_23150 [Pedobacter sp. PF22-3]|uniref:hypothetical protein n=1 Tax=Pedobacter sp. PF22-3 TaxID=2994467 RepID=UPI0022475B28|nr:hypothetical protein [Pedobacter sp. PF22-3]MCX2496404.1 hypothetical protein [Pedobacter sp. PF22-3]